VVFSVAEIARTMIGIILAGGRASRMGGIDKGALTVGGLRIADRIRQTLEPQCERVVISSNVGAGGVAELPVVRDSVPGFPGPLAGVLSALDFVAEHHPDAPFAVTVPTDTPFLPSDLVARLQDQRVADRAEIVCACSGGAVHHVVALWSVALRASLRTALVAEDVRRVRTFLERHAVAYATWPVTPVDPFFNVNTPEDLAEANRLSARLA
jgi:molybdenum cofactor guanylyltransferase